jgi:hypothetical protein
LSQGRRSAGKLLERDEARRIAVNIAKLWGRTAKPLVVQPHPAGGFAVWRFRKTNKESGPASGTAK